jgi:hypothetical protein
MDKVAGDDSAKDGCGCEDASSLTLRGENAGDGEIKELPGPYVRHLISTIFLKQLPQPCLDRST